MHELKDATAEMLAQENPTLMQSIANDAVTAERQRIQDIEALTPKGAKWEAMAKKAKADGTSADDFLRAVIAEQRKTGEEYLEARSRETKPAGDVGAGDNGDYDDNDLEAKIDKAAKDVAELAKGMTVSSLGMG